MNDRLKTALNATNSSITPPPLEAPNERSDAGDSSQAPCELTKPEFQAYEKIVFMIKDYVDTESITCKRTESYVAVLYQNNTRKWIARISITAEKIILILPDLNKQEIRCYISNLYEMENYKPYISTAPGHAMFPLIVVTLSHIVDRSES